MTSVFLDMEHWFPGVEVDQLVSQQFCCINIIWSSIVVRPYLYVLKLHRQSWQWLLLAILKEWKSTRKIASEDSWKDWKTQVDQPSMLERLAISTVEPLSPPWENGNVPSWQLVLVNRFVSVFSFIYYIGTVKNRRLTFGYMDFPQVAAKVTR